MKKVFFIFLFALMTFSCSNNDDSSKAQASINPPNWIHGTWQAENLINFTSGFRFTSDDIILLSGSTNISHKGQMETYSNTDYDISVDESISSDKYTVYFNYPQGMSVSYSFSKIDEETIQWDDASFGSLVLIKQ